MKHRGKINKYIYKKNIVANKFKIKSKIDLKQKTDFLIVFNELLIQIFWNLE